MFGRAILAVLLFFSSIALVELCPFLEQECPDGSCINLWEECPKPDCTKGGSGCDSATVPLRTVRSTTRGTSTRTTSGPTTSSIQRVPNTWPQLVTVPNTQKVNPDQDVVIQCRDEGSSRSNVQWFRGIDYGPLPNTATDINGRLTLIRVKCQDRGAYVCRPVDRLYRRFYAIAIVDVLCEKSAERSTTSVVVYTPPITETPAVPCNFTAANGSRCYTICKDLVFTCADGHQIPLNFKCNRVNDCEDGSDEFNCTIGCRSNEFQCGDGSCISGIKFCNGHNDCSDGSDEKQCTGNWPPKIMQLPKSKVKLDCQDRSGLNMLELECKFVGNPVPKISWKKYEGNVPSKCQQSTMDGHGILKCPDFQQSDQGAYSCIGENLIGVAESQPKSIVTCKEIACKNGFKVKDSHNVETCLDCYCSGKSDQCHGVGSDLILHDIVFSEKKELFVLKNGQIAKGVSSDSAVIEYCSVPKSTLDSLSFLKSYGRNLRVPKRDKEWKSHQNAPDIVIMSNDLILIHSFNKISHETRTMEVRFWEGFWHHPDKRPATRWDIMKVLSNLEVLLLRCQNIQKATVESSRVSQGSDSDSYLEKCSCPSGYDGLSCQLCAPGYTKIIFEQDFNCTKVLEPCQVGYIGENCDKCDESKGYFKNSFGKCEPSKCDKDGSINFSNVMKQCICKELVTGKLCDECKAGSFFLEGSNPKGCKQCWCNDVSQDCRSSDWYKTMISSTPLGGYNSSHERDFWLLPSEFNGNKLTAYGGKLRYKMTYLPNIMKQPKPVTVEILGEDDITLKYINNNLDHITRGLEKTWEVPMEEPFWLDRKHQVVDRRELLRVLSHVKAIYVESPYAIASQIVNLTLAQLDIAEELNNDLFADGEKASKVEKCICPAGYEGLSCERCSIGYYKNRAASNTFTCLKCECANCDPERGCMECKKGEYRDNPGEMGFPVCRKCPCNQNEEDCFKDNYDQVVCRCKSGYYGINCEKFGRSSSTHLHVEISPIRVKDKKVGTVVNFNCTYDSTEKMVIVFEKYEENGSSEKQLTGVLQSSDTSTTMTTNVTIEPDLKAVKCIVYDSKNVEVGHVVALIEGTVLKFKKPSITNCYDEPKLVNEKEDIDLICEASGNPPPHIQWYKKTEKGLIPQDTAEGVHSVMNASLEQNGTIYTCMAKNEAGDDKCSTHIIVKERCDVISIQPMEMKVKEGKTAQFLCSTTNNGPVWWSRVDRNGVMRGTERKGELTIQNVQRSDAGEYACYSEVVNTGQLLNKTAKLEVEIEGAPPVVKIVQGDSNINVGQRFEIDCEVSGRPEPKVTWKYMKRDLPSGVIVNDIDHKIVILWAKQSDSGLYECKAENIFGSSSSRIHIQVLEAPRIRIEPPVAEVLQGQEVILRCIVESGYPKPTLLWYPEFNKFSANDGDTLTIKEAQETDSGRYVCTAENSAGFAEAVAEVIVKIPPTVRISPHGVLDVYVKDNVKFECEAGGLPQPEIQWIQTTKEGGLNGLLTEKVFPTKENILEILVTSDLQSITCVATNDVGKANESVIIRTKEPKTPSQGLSKEVELGSMVEMIFEGVGDNFTCSRKGGSLLGDECYIHNGLEIPSVQIQHNGTYVCKSREPPYEEKLFTILVVGFVPMFEQKKRSYLALSLAHNINNELSIEITFKAENLTGMLIFPATGNELCVSLKEGYLEAWIVQNRLRRMVLKSKLQIKLKVWYTAAFKLSQKQAELVIYGNQGEIFDSVTESVTFKVDLDGLNELHIGGTNIWNKRKYKLYHERSFGGCISRLIVNEREYHLTKEAKYSTAVSLCKICSSPVDPCGKRGVCLDAPTQYGFVCVCGKDEAECPRSCSGRGCKPSSDLCQLVNPCRQPQHKCKSWENTLQCSCANGFSGTTCENEERFEFGLDGNGYVKVPPSFLPRNSLDDPEMIRIKFTPSTRSGLLLWQGDEENYLYIGVDAGSLEYIYNNQGANLKVKATLKTHVTYDAVIRRRNNTVLMKIDGISYRGNTEFKTNRVNGNIYIGGIPEEMDEIVPYTVVKSGYTGCIHRITFGNSNSVNVIGKNVATSKILHSCGTLAQRRNEISISISSEYEDNEDE